MPLPFPRLEPGEIAEGNRRSPITAEEYAKIEAFRAYERARRVEENHHNRRVSPEMRALLRQRIARLEKRWPDFLAIYEERHG